jgi:hypothetical protein
LDVWNHPDNQRKQIHYNNKHSINNCTISNNNCNINNNCNSLVNIIIKCHCICNLFHLPLNPLNFNRFDYILINVLSNKNTIHCHFDITWPLFQNIFENSITNSLVNLENVIQYI